MIDDNDDDDDADDEVDDDEDDDDADDEDYDDDDDDADDDDDDEDFNVVADAAIIVAVEIGYLCICTSLPSTADVVISVPAISCGNYC